MTLTNDINLQEGIDYKLLDDARIAKKLTVSQTATLAKVPEGTTKNILNGKTGNPGADNLGRLCKVLDVPIEKVLRQEERVEIEKQGIKDEIASIIALKEIYELQITMMKESNEEHIKNIREHYERHIADLEKHYEKRLADKREHIETILLDKKWFRLASIFSVLALLGVFFFIEFMTPGHGWFTFGR